MNISNITSSIGVNLEAAALQQFGAAIQNKIGGGLNSIINSGAVGNSSFYSGSLSPSNAGLGSYLLSHGYASNISSGNGGFDPKTKFLFRVTFRFNPRVREVAAAFGDKIFDIVDRNLTYVMKDIDMPKYKFVYDEYNYYNFRTKMLKRIDHDPLSFKFYDDIANNSLDFLNVYLKLLSPIHRHDWESGAVLENQGLQPDYTNIESKTSAQRSVLGKYGDAVNILEKIIIDQYYLDRGKSGQNNSPSAAIKMNSFIFTNPRLESFDIDSNDYEQGSDPRFISCSFDFDALHMITGEPGSVPDSAFSWDLLSGSGNIPKHSRTSLNAGGGGMMSGFMTNALGSLGSPQQMLGNIINQNIPLSGGGGLNPNINSKGLIGMMAQNTMQNGVNKIAAGITAPLSSKISDTSIGGKITGQIRSRLSDIG